MKNQVEPQLKVGVLTSVDRVIFHLNGVFLTEKGMLLPPGKYEALPASGEVQVISDAFKTRFAEFVTTSAADGNSSFMVSDVEIGIGFHWQQTQAQEFKGNLKLLPNAEGGLTLVNEIGLEAYLESVISSEMSDRAHPELLKAHAVISRSWVMAQLDRRQDRKGVGVTRVATPGVICRWYDRENHVDFDLCADDHCQRYQGVTRATTTSARAAVSATRGKVLEYDERVCDTRFSKSCGGMTEAFSSAWEDAEVPYLAARFDGKDFPGDFGMPLTEEENAREWIESSPPAFCNMPDREVLDQILPDFDRATSDFYRWRIEIAQDELQRLLRAKLGEAGELGAIKALLPVVRGPSARLSKIRIEGTQGAIEIGKELEIRRVLSRSHLYSSAFIVETVYEASSIPSAFILKGAGWGHGVGLCQIGAAVMAERGYRYNEILEHYFHSAKLENGLCVK